MATKDGFGKRRHVTGPHQGSVYTQRHTLDLGSQAVRPASTAEAFRGTVNPSLAKPRASRPGLLGSSVAPLSPADTFVFICWSAPRSLALAERFRTFLVTVIPSLSRRVFSSPQIEKGARWFEEVLRHLEAAQVGI